MDPSILNKAARKYKADSVLAEEDQPPVLPNEIFQYGGPAVVSGDPQTLTIHNAEVG